MYQLQSFTAASFTPVTRDSLIETVPGCVDFLINPIQQPDISHPAPVIIGTWTIRHNESEISIVEAKHERTSAEYFSLRVVDAFNRCFAGLLDADSANNPDGMVITENFNEETELAMGRGLGTRRLIIANAAAKMIFSKSVRSYPLSLIDELEDRSERTLDADRAWDRLVNAGFAEKLTLADDNGEYTQYRFL
jgi:hypothetical protein